MSACRTLCSVALVAAQTQKLSPGLSSPSCCSEPACTDGMHGHARYLTPDTTYRTDSSRVCYRMQGSSGFAAALQDDSPASNGRLLGDGSDGPPRLGIFKRAMSLGSASQQRQGQSNRLSRNHPHTSNIFDPLPDTDEES